MPEWKLQHGTHALRFHRAFLTVRIGWSEQDGGFIARVDGARTYELSRPCETVEEAKAAGIDLLKELVASMASELEQM